MRETVNYKELIEAGIHRIEFQPFARNAGLPELSQTHRPPDTARFYHVKVRIAP